MERSERAEHFEHERLNPPDLETAREARGERDAASTVPAAAENEEKEGGGGVRCLIQSY